jgi:F-type H+-transporting ATPase subunit epsilon
MATTRLEIVTAERVVFSEDVDVVIAPGIEGQLGVLPNHAPLMTTLEPGELLVRRGGEEFSLAISGGFIEVRPDRIIVLADAAERAEEAKRRAEERLKEHVPEVDLLRAEAALRRSLARLQVATRRKRRSKSQPPPG